jgi:hypothetical protein
MTPNQEAAEKLIAEWKAKALQCSYPDTREWFYAKAFGLAQAFGIKWEVG